MSAGPAKAIRILYVEDAFDQALLVKAMLQSHGEFDVTHRQLAAMLAACILPQAAFAVLATQLGLKVTGGHRFVVERFEQFVNCSSHPRSMCGSRWWAMCF